MIKKHRFLGFVIVLSVSLTACFVPWHAGNEPLQPLGYVPFPQNGYGSGSDQLGQPDDVEFLNDGSLVVSDVDNNRIQVFSQEGQLLKSISAATLNLPNPGILPTGITRDKEGFIYVTLEGAGRIARFTPKMDFERFIGIQGQMTPGEYYAPENRGKLMKPQGIIASSSGDLFVVDMNPDVFNTPARRSFGFRKFIRTNGPDGQLYYEEDLQFAQTQEITKRMYKSEGMALWEERGWLLVSEEKPSKKDFANSQKYRYIAVFDMNSGQFLNQFFGISMKNDTITGGYHKDSVEGLVIIEGRLWAVDEKAGSVFCYDIETGTMKGAFGSRAPFYCDDESDCVIDGINYNEQTIIAGIAKPHLLNMWEKNELASPDGVAAARFKNGCGRLAVVDQWNSRILIYDLDQIYKSFK